MGRVIMALALAMPLLAQLPQPGGGSGGGGSSAGDQPQNVSLSSSGTCTFVGTVPVLAAYATGISVVAKLNNTCAASGTLNLNGLGARTVFEQNGTTANSNQNGDFLLLIYDAALASGVGGWRKIRPSTGTSTDVQKGDGTGGLTAAVANTDFVTPSGLIGWWGGSTVTQVSLTGGGVQYMGQGWGSGAAFSSTFGDRAWIAPFAGRVTALFIRSNQGSGGNQPASGSLVCAPYVNGVAGALTATIPAGQLNDFTASGTGSVSFALGDRVSMGCQNNASGASAFLLTWSMRFTL